MIIKYNDYELLYLINEKDDKALEIMFEKYKPLIRTRLYDFKIQKRNYDDFFQEGLIILGVAINTYNVYQKKTFTKYFDLILQRRIRDLLNKERKYFYNVTLYDVVETICENASDANIIDSIDKKDLTDLEKKAFEMIFEENKKTIEVARELACDERKIYNAISRAKKKIRNNKK